MQKLTPLDLYSLEQYHKVRPEFRQQVLAHKRRRLVGLGPDATAYFEDALTVKYQVQEMLRVERIFEEEGIREELDAYNPLVPDGCNLKATFMLEYADSDDRRAALAQLVGVEHRVWARVEGHEPVWAVANEDLERSTEEKTSAVHFLRFEFTPAMIAALKSGASLSLGVDHPNYRHAADPLPGPVREALVADFDDAGSGL